MTGEAPDVIFACDMTALAPAERERHLRAMDALFASTLRIEEVGDGYSFELPATPETMLLVAEFISRERRCCPFFDFTVEVPAGDSEISMLVTGPAGVKPFIQVEFRGHLHGRVAFPAVYRTD